MSSIESEGFIDFGPGHKDHGRLEWPDVMRSASITISTDLHRLLTHNDAPSFQEYKEVQSLREEIQTKMHAKREEIRLLEEELTRCKNEQAQLEKQHFTLGIPLGPIRRIPSDILYQIVETCPRHHDVCNEDLKFCIHIPTTLSHVCRSWRQTVHDIPTAWQDIRIVSSSIRSHGDAFPDQKRQFEHYSQLSGILPLRVYLDGSHRKVAANQFDDTVGMAPFIDWMVQYCGENKKFLDRLHVLCPRKNKHDLLKCFAHAASGAYPLQVKTCLFLSSSDSLNLHTVVPAVTNDTEVITQLLNYLPQVRHLWLGDSFNELPWGLLPPETLAERRKAWSKLTRLRLDVTFSTEKLSLINILLFCPYLEGAHFNIRCTNQPPPPQFDDILVHRHLKELYVDLSVFQVGHNFLVPAFMGCRFPNVTSLQLQLRRDRFGYSAAMSSYAFPSLRSLVINTISRRSDNDSFFMKTISSLGTCRTITDLTIFSHNLTIAHHFHRFAKECGGGLPLPSLRNLQLRIIGVECFKAASEDTLWFAHREIESLIEIKHHRPSINISIHWLIPYLSMSHVRYPHFVDYEDPSGCSPVEVFINLEKSFFDGDGSNFGIDTQIVQVDYNRVFDLFQEHPVTWFR